MKKRDLLYSSVLSVLFLIVVGGYYLFYLKRNNTVSIESFDKIQLDSINYETYDANLIDTTTSYILSEEKIWSKLYPNKKRRSNNYGGVSDKAVMRKVEGLNDWSKYYYTTIHKLFYYKHNTRQKAFVVLVSYPFDYHTEEVFDCHACTPITSIMNWYYEKGEWILENHIEQWQGGMGSWGQPAEMTFNMSSLGYTLEMDHALCQGGYCEGYYVLYEIPSMKIITEKSYTTDDSDGISDSIFDDVIIDSINYK